MRGKKDYSFTSPTSVEAFYKLIKKEFSHDFYDVFRNKKELVEKTQSFLHKT